MFSKIFQVCLLLCTIALFGCYVIPTSLEREADRIEYVTADTYHKYGDHYE